jgi:hypothetical protein
MFTILKPADGDRVVQDQLTLLVKPPKVGVPSVTVLEFRWLDAPPTQPPYIYTFAVETPKLLQDYLVDQQVTRGNAGRWEVRARIAAQPVPGPWSLPARFQLVVTQPTQSQSSTIPQSSPLPSSSIVQPPSQGGSSAMPSQAPGALKGMIRSRGVEGDEPAQPEPETPVTPEQPSGTK